MTDLVARAAAAICREPAPKTPPPHPFDVERAARAVARGFAPPKERGDLDEVVATLTADAAADGRLDLTIR